MSQQGNFVDASTPGDFVGENGFGVFEEAMYQQIRSRRAEEEFRKKVAPALQARGINTDRRGRKLASPALHALHKSKHYKKHWQHHEAH